jgi:hypothetical protein
MAAHSPETTARETDTPRATPAAPAGRRSGRATTAMILGIVSIPAALLAILGVILGVLAIVFGAIARGEIRRNGFTNSSQAMAGIICGSIGLVLGLINMIAGVLAAA